MSKTSGQPRRTAADQVPTSWLDPLLSGPTAVIGQPPYDCRDIERLLRAITARLEEPGRV